MKRPISFLLGALFLASTGAANNVFLHVGTSPIQWAGTADLMAKTADTTQGASVTTVVTSTIVGPVPGGYWPNATVGVIITNTAGTGRRVWLTAPLSSGVTISSTITCHLWGLESATTANAGYACEFLRWTPTGGVVSSICKTGASAEWTATAAVNATPPSCTATSTALAIGDRVLIVIYNIDAGGTQTASGRTMTIDYDGATGANGDSYVTFSQTLAFSAESNNAKPNRGITQ